MSSEGVPLTGNRLAAAISDSISQLHARYYGKGPREAKTYLGDDFIFCVLSEPFTTVEQTLIEVGREQDVRQMRQVFQDAMERRFKHAVEELTGKTVSTFMSQTHVGPDMAIEVFKIDETPDED